MFLNSLLANSPESANKDTGERSFKIVLILEATATCWPFCACLAFVATKGNKPITFPEPWTNPDLDVEKTFIGISSFLAWSKTSTIIVFPAASTPPETVIPFLTPNTLDPINFLTCGHMRDKPTAPPDHNISLLISTIFLIASLFL